jgi:hypothetical protein
LEAQEVWLRLITQGKNGEEFMLGSMRRHGGTIVVAAIVGAVAAGSPAVAGEIVAFAKSAGNANTVNKIGASKTPRPGMLVPLNSKGQLPAGVIPAGRQAVGSAGPSGPQGPQGASGPAGANGASGPQGPKGLTGADGATGLQGLKGDTGDTGAAGANGSDGAPGAIGPQGPKGDKGEGGAAGANGANGLDGALGAIGPQGLKGDKGDAGTNGNDGAPGAAGSQGPKGDKGDAGTNGNDGAPGAAGSQGPKGDKGDAGAAGANGNDGAAGAQGPKGDKGDQGAAGGLVYPSLVDVNPVPRATGSHLWGNVFVDERAWNNAYRRSYPDGNETSYIEWRVPLAAGTWDMEVTHVAHDDAAILSFSLDGTDIGSVDAYAPTLTFNVSGEVSNITVATSGMHTLRVRTDAKNPLSSHYYGYLVWLRLVQQ